ncbi:hypothetical protein PHLGIDRAFT_18988 [Phlebiopsis gigantea 11061_1 CR5-6]|uniref:Uncharacterized protein n=1 Tax=Phlebiopsis gigantea (strain 11061_1 CR5-6) TaxID=745531 RepID=A0A0C3NSM4_PHLG1|nr:hypothetical protein PHLGIDRAFT_18988 [Phlebiopsis gigantea 11061_1 CR5-6]
MAPRTSSKPQIVPPGGSSEPSEPSEVRPEDKSKTQLVGEQEENPQLIAHRPGKQEADRKERKRYDLARDGFAGKRIKSRL